MTDAQNGTATADTQERQPPGETYDLMLEGDGISIRQVISREKAMQVVMLLLCGSASSQPPAAGNGPALVPMARIPSPASGRTDGEPPLSIGEFLHEHNAKRNPDKITAIAAYLMDYDQKPHFTKDDVIAEFQAAGEPSPANFSRDWRWVVTNRWIAVRRDDPDTYYVTTLGRKALQERFSDEIRKASPLPRRRGAKKNKADSS